jgi:NitT/TauT family transport system ATP-binding protein
MKTNVVGRGRDQGVLVSARNVSKYYGEDRGHILVLDDVSLDLASGEFVALLGPSGSGKSTLLRILAGLIPPSKGEVTVNGQPLRGTNPAVAMVFQSFALYPWLTVYENVELGLLAKSLPAADRRTRVLRAIDVIGLDGFEDAYPKELSGGMRQRVGFARALVVEPDVLLMDEPFSALDVLTAENLRHELRDLWLDHKIPIRSILIVTHNIAEAVSLADRLLVFGANPGRIRVELAGLAPAERRRSGARQTALVDTIYRIMTNPQEDVAKLLPGARVVQPAAPSQPYQFLPAVSIGDLTGFLERLQGIGGREDLAEVAQDLQLEADELLPLVSAANLLGMVDVEEGDVLLTSLGRRFAAADVQEKKVLFRRQASSTVDLIRQIERGLATASDHEVEDDVLLDSLERFFSPVEARRQLDTAIDWGRYAELFAYDDDSGLLYYEENPVKENAR